MQAKMEHRKILITAKTYPSISTKYREIVCTAGILLDDNENPQGWIRLYPVKFRSLEFGKRYKKFNIISANIIKNHKDNRFESYRPEEESVQVLKEIPETNNWVRRKELILPFQFASTQNILEQGRSLGIIKPKQILSTYVEKDDREWSEQKLAVLAQCELFESIPSDLEKIPYKFGYEFIDKDDKKHRFSVIDWEICQLYRNCRDGSRQLNQEQREAEAVQKVKEKLEKLRKSDLHFIVGNQQRFQESFMIISLFYPPVVEYEQMSLL